MKTLPAVDVVIVGGGWAGLLMAKELGVRTALSVVVLERGGATKTADYADDMDEVDYAIRLHMMQDASKETATLRHNHSERALPLRQFACFQPGTGVGGTGEHWAGVSPRALPDCFEILSSTTKKYGKARLPEDHSMQDWGVTYDEMEPYYAGAEAMMGISGKAGNLRGQRMEGGNIFEGWRSAEYPTPPTKIPYYPHLFREATRSLGYHPHPIPSATISQAYTNPDGVSRPGCTYCGYCERFGCMIGAKAQPSNTLLPVIERHKNVSIRTGAEVRRIVHEKTGQLGQAKGVQYRNAAGEEFFQPAALVFLSSWTLNNTRLLLLSGAGDAYDPATGKGTIGKNLTHQVTFAAAMAFFKQPLNRFMGSGAAGIRVSDLDGDLLDHSTLPFLRGGFFSAESLTSRPIGNFGIVPPSVKATWGAEWKKASVDYYDRTAKIGFSGEHLAYRGNCMDLDPTYRDHCGDPLLRLTLDWHDNERQMAKFMSAKALEMARAMGATEVSPAGELRNYDTRIYQSTHLQGGTIMGASPEQSVVNPFLQHWQFSNLFVLGGSTFPQNPAVNCTLTILALTLRSADAVVNRYLKNPGALA
ncbi:MAG: GMC family oxidoreductase [Acidipila sp.]|nr:GMC family oxidoreductase [Acidipila sp.]